MDLKIFNFFNNLYGKSSALHFFWKISAQYLIYIIPLFLIYYWFFGSRRLALKAFLAGVFAWWGIAHLIGNLYFRARPLATISGQEFLFHRPTYSFPSDHAAFLFAIAFSFLFAGKKSISYLLFAISIVISLSRIVVGFHWPSDIIVGWVVGILASYLIYLIKEPLEKYLINPVIWLARKIRL